MADKHYTLAQEAAIAWDNGSLLVLAGPGSGKTAVLTTRVSRILNLTSEENFKILALTFTNKAALEMSDRILKLVPEAKGRIFVGTFHSFCAEVLRNHGSSIGIKPDFTIFSDESDLRSIVKELQDEHHSLFKDEVVFDLKIINAIQYFQEHLCYTEAQIDSKMPDTPHSELFKWMCIRYQQKLLELNALDFNSIVMLAYHLFLTNPMIAKLYRLAYRYVCIDEFQDTNMAQYKLIKSFIPTKNSNLFIVADDDQVIYGWNGASNKRLLEFKEDYSAQIIQLCENFRCPAQVVSLANILISNNSGRVENKAPLIAMKENVDTGNIVHLSCFSDEKSEIEFVSNEIVRIRQENANISIGVIARNNKLMQAQFNDLKAKGLPVVKSKRKDEFENLFIRWIHFTLKLANRRTEERLLSEVVNCLKNIDDFHLDVDEIIAISKTNGEDYLTGFCSFLQQHNHEFALNNSIITKLCERLDFIGFIQDAFKWADILVQKNSNELSEEHRTEYLTEYENEKKAWNNIYQQISNNYGLEISLSAFLQEFSMVSKEPDPKETDIQCLTIHASKGKEFDYVFVIGLVEDELPSFQSIKKGDNSIEMEEERRNCFVAITRTKQKLYLSYAERYYGWNKNPSRFLKEMQLL